MLKFVFVQVVKARHIPSIDTSKQGSDKHANI